MQYLKIDISVISMCLHFSVVIETERIFNKHEANLTPSV